MEIHDYSNFLVLIGMWIISFGIWTCFFRLFPKMGFSEKSARAASQATGLMHGLIAVPLAIADYYYSLQWDHAAPMNEIGRILLNISVTYFIVDGLYFISQGDPLILIHHIVAASFGICCFYSNYASLAYSAAIIVGEVTNPLQSIWFLSREGNHKKIHERISPIYTAVFIPIRIIVTPIWCGIIAYDLVLSSSPSSLQFRNSFPKIHFFMVFSMIPMTMGGWVWSYKIWNGFKKFTKKLQLEKQQQQHEHQSSKNKKQKQKSMDQQDQDRDVLLSSPSASPSPAPSPRTKKTKK